jgi:transcription-repair coupling factor (superfamily II helicase)
VDNLQRLIEAYGGDTRLREMSDFIANSEQASRIVATGLVGAQECFALLGLQQLGIQNHVFIALDKEDAAYLQNALDNLNTERPISLFPDSFKRPLQYDQIDAHNVLQRTEAINRLSLNAKGGEIVITYPEAIFEKVVDPQLIRDKRIDIEVGESLDFETITEVLVEYGFDRVDFVYEPGQFAIRGGIVDIFSYGNEYPYRIELFDDEIESIRMFNPGTQLSIRTISKVAIIPNITGQFSSDDKVPLFEVFPEDTLVWIRDTDHMLDRLQACFDKAEKFAEDVEILERSELREIFKDRAFIYPQEVLNHIDQRSIVFLTRSESVGQYDKTIDFGGKPQPNFNRSFELLIEDLQANEAAGIENYIFTDSSKQIERFYSIFEDLEVKVKFNAITKAIHKGFKDENRKVACYTDHEVFQRFHRYKVRQGFTRDQALNLKMIRELVPGDYVVHIDHGIGKYSGLEKININGHIQESVRLFYRQNDILYVSINSLHKITKYVGKDGTPPKLDKIGGDTWKALKNKTKKKVKDIAKDLIKLYAKRKAAEGFACAPDGYLQNELEASFIYEDTPDQLSSTIAVKEDMEQTYPMDRLICGDVGFGKTEIAIRAAFKAVVNGKQVAILVPTTILALQHNKTFGERLKDFPVTVDYVNRFKSTAEKNKTFERAAEGKLDILIGTHALLNKKVKFKDLGLLIIDEEQKFGVVAKEKLRSLKVNVDTLTLTATPIPRTLQFSLMNARDLSIIKTAPPNRQPIHTERRVFNDEIIKESIYYEIHRGGQVFFVHNRVKSLPDITALVKRLCPDVEIAMAHGQMEPKQLEKTLVDFINHKYDVLVCTNIIETGLDISNANTIIINNAHHFGLSDLHQLRGRVGRSNKKAFCYLFAPPLSVLTTEARKRLKTLEEFSDLGSGFHIAMKDLDIRGAGNLLGAEQSGFIADIGYETYQRILEEAVLELKEHDFKEEFRDELEKNHSYVRDVEIDTDIEMLIPDAYINSVQERMNLYKEIDQIEDEDGLIAFRNSLKDRFGGIPIQVDELFNGLRLRWVSKRLGFERVLLKNNGLSCFFIANPQSSFYETKMFQALLDFISTAGALMGLSLKQGRSFLIMKKPSVKNLKEARIILERLEEQVLEKLKASRSE